MTRLLALALLLALATPAAAEVYWLDARSIEPEGRRFYLLRYRPVTVDPGEIAGVWLSVESCPGGADSFVGTYVNTSDDGDAFFDEGNWRYLTPYRGYRSSTFVWVENRSDGPMTFRFKVSLRCDE